MERKKKTANHLCFSAISSLVFLEQTPLNPLLQQRLEAEILRNIAAKSPTVCFSVQDMFLSGLYLYYILYIYKQCI